MPPKPKSPIPLDDLSNALYSIYYHCEWRGMAGTTVYADESNERLDLANLPAPYGIKPLSDAIAILNRNLTASKGKSSQNLRKFVIALLVRSSHIVVGARYDSGALTTDVQLLLTGLSAQDHATWTRLSRAGGIAVLPLDRHIISLLLTPDGPGSSPETRFKEAFGALMGQDMSSYIVTPTYENIG